jgi:hypothetical protein
MYDSVEGAWDAYYNRQMWTLYLTSEDWCQGRYIDGAFDKLKLAVQRAEVALDRLYGPPAAEEGEDR